MARATDDTSNVAASAGTVAPVTVGLVAKRLSPKRPRTESAGLADVFPYYAGFSFEWACEELAKHSPGPESLVLDPWNGSGTTTRAARALGMRSVGLDRNPVANIVARLRMDPPNEDFEFPPPPRGRELVEPDDPLLSWFAPDAASRLRAWANYSRSLPVRHGALLYVAIFRVAKQLTASFEGSNPTWVRRVSETRPPVTIQDKDLDNKVLSACVLLRARLASEVLPDAPSALLTGSSKELPLRDGSIHRVLTSPPYLTRIDYAVAYARELAVIDIDVFNNRRIRADLMGTTLIRGEVSREPILGPVAEELVDSIASHGSYASGVYYLKQANQYFGDLTTSLDEVTRVCAGGAVMTLVVQDSYYKDVPVRLGEIYRDEAELRGWEFLDEEPFEVIRSLTTLNASAKLYPKGKVAETVLTIRKK